MLLTVLLILMGVVAGAAAGLFGIGGGLLFTPVLFYLFQTLGLEQPATWAIATSLFCTFSASLSSTIQQRKQKNLYWREGLWVGFAGSIAVFAGKSVVLSAWFSSRLFAGYFILLLIWVAVLFIRRSGAEYQTPAGRNQSRVGHFTVAGGAGGFIAALAGVGGGIVMVPIMNLMFQIPVRKAVSISSLAIVFISLSGWLQYALLTDAPPGASSVTLGYVDFGTALPLIAGAFIGGFAGVRLGKFVNQRLLYLLFALLITVIAISMLGELFG